MTVARGRTVLLERFSLELDAGELVHLRGANGSGFAVVVTILCLLFPIATAAFDRSPGAGDLVAAGMAHLACGARWQARWRG